MAKTKTPTPKATPQPRYRWAHPSEWLNEKIEEATHAELRGICTALLSVLAEDDVQDLFQGEMDAAGYFQDLNLCPDCQTPLDRTTEHDGHPVYCPECDREVELP